MLKCVSVGPINFKHLPNHLVNQSQILCGASMCKGNKSFLNDDPRLTLIYFLAMPTWVTSAFQEEKMKAVDFSETVPLLPVT